MSNQHDDTGAKPQVIDLEAEEIRSDSDAPASAAAQEIREDAAHAFSPPPPRKKSRGAATWIIAALILGGLGGGWLYRGVLSSYLPSNEMTALKNQVAALEQNNTDLAAQIAAVKQGADGAAATADSAATAAAQATDAAKAASAQIADVGARLDQADQQGNALQDQLKAARADLDALRKSMSSAPAAAAHSSMNDSTANTLQMAPRPRIAEARSNWSSSNTEVAGTSMLAGAPLKEIEECDAVVVVVPSGSTSGEACWPSIIAWCGMRTR